MSEGLSGCQSSLRVGNQQATNLEEGEIKQLASKKNHLVNK